MKTLKKLFAIVALFSLKMPNLLAQDEGTYIENLDVQDSSYMEPVLDAGQSSGSNTTVIIIVAVVVIAVVAFFILRKKKK